MAGLVYAPFPDRASARAVAATLLDENLIGCANLLGAVEALFDWQGERGEAQEIGVLFKTDAALLEQVIARIEVLHPYAAPAVLGWKCDAAASETAAWLGALRPAQ
jgi:periplasmic divalent cation tolerance protein